jgi:hypothetical protein
VVENFPVQNPCFEVRNFPEKTPKIFPKIIFCIKSKISGISGYFRVFPEFPGQIFLITGQKCPKFCHFGSFLTTFGGIFGLIFGFIFGQIFGLSKQIKFRTFLPERKSTGNSGPEFPVYGSHFPENTPDFEIITGTHCLII